MESKDPTKVTIGLFGSCGESKWRNAFMAEYAKRDIIYFNPQVENWDSSRTAHEAWHLANDEIILFPVTGETYGLGSLAETGFSILQAIRLDSRREFITLIDMELAPELLQDARAAEESLRTRALVKSHLQTLRLHNLYLVESLTDLLNASLELHDIEQNRRKIRHHART